MLFKDLGVIVVSGHHGVIVVSGHRFLGGVIGDKDTMGQSYIYGKVDGWVKCVQHYHMLLLRHLEQHLQA